MYLFVFRVVWISVIQKYETVEVVRWVEVIFIANGPY